MLPTLIKLTVIVGGLGMYLALPSSWHPWRRAGAWLAVAGMLALLLAQASVGRLGGFGVTFFFYVFGIPTVASAFLAVTSRKPIYCALWFGITLLGTAGLFLLIGAQFLAVSTIVVYAGAILVTLLFVIMLAQQAGAAVYDRWAREPFLATLVGSLMAGALLLGIVSPKSQKSFSLNESAALDTDRAHLRRGSVAELGVQLFTEQLISIEIAGTLLLVALVGAVCITGAGGERELRLPPGDRK